MLINLYRRDELAWVRYKNLEKRKTAREHIVTVTHAKAQNAIGQGTLGKLLQYRNIQ